MMANAYISYNGQFFPEGAQVISPANRAFRYGDGLFETIRIMDGNPCFLPDHFHRLKKGMELFQMEIKNDFELTISHNIEAIIKKNAIKQGGRIRLAVFRNDGGLYAPDDNGVSFIIEANELPNNHYSLNAAGLMADLFKAHLKPVGVLANIKYSGNIMPVLAGIFKNERQVDECIVLNEHERIAEGLSSNIFLIKGKALFTPSLKEGCVAGVMRKNVLETAKEIGIRTEEVSIKQDYLLNADEVFFTNSINGIRWLKAMGKKRYFNRTSQLLLPYLQKKAVNSYSGFQES